MARKTWTKDEQALLARLGPAAATMADWEGIAKKFPGRSATSVRIHYSHTLRIPRSPYPVYNDPLVMKRDALVLNDLEAPFHHAEFVSRCLELAERWNIKGLVLGGDFLHNDALSSFEPAFVDDEAKIAPELVQTILELVPARSRRKVEAELEKRVGLSEPNHSSEMERAKGVLLSIGRQFEEIHCILGNHEGRLLRMLHSPLDPKHVLKEVGVVDNPKWKIRPYYFSLVVSGGETFRITHPKNTAKASAWKLAAKHQQHVLMAHNHQVVFQFDPSGEYYAIETGCCVDETRLPYASQRDNTQHAHKLGAVVVKDGHPWLLHERTPWEEL